MGFQVEDNDIEIFRVAVDYSFGGSRVIHTSLFFRESDRSGVIDLEGGSRWIRAVRFYYRTIGSQPRPAAPLGRPTAPAVDGQLWLIRFDRDL
jgi:hypothetical protein